MEAYIQSRVIRRTLEAISFETRRNLLDGGDSDRPEVALEKLVKDAAGAQAHSCTEWNK